MVFRRKKGYSKKEAERYASYGYEKIEKVLEIPLVDVNDIIRDHFNGCLNFFSLDVEGMDFEVLKSFDFSKYRPEVFCIETLSYAKDNSKRKLKEIIEYMHENVYMSYADTYINTIFADLEKWKNKQ